ncbi:hypothetical protein ACNKHR_20530 [Shigella flexneri]
MMEILRGSPALSAFRINKLLARFQAARLPVHNIYAEYVHFADLNAPLNDDEHAQLERLLKYGRHSPATPARQTPAGDPASWHHLSLRLRKRPILPITAGFNRVNRLGAALLTI